MPRITSSTGVGGTPNVSLRRSISTMLSYCSPPIISLVDAGRQERNRLAGLHEIDLERDAQDAAGLGYDVLP